MEGGQMPKRGLGCAVGAPTRQCGPLGQLWGRTAKYLKFRTGCADRCLIPDAPAVTVCDVFVTKTSTVCAWNNWGDGVPHNSLFLFRCLPLKNPGESLQNQQHGDDGILLDFAVPRTISNNVLSTLMRNLRRDGWGTFAA